MRLSKTIGTLLVGLSIGASPRGAAAQRSADEVLKRMDKLQHRASHETARLEMRLYVEGREVRRRELALQSTIDTAGHTRALIEFTSPPDIRGMRLLTIETGDGDDQRIYLPALRRVQRIAGSAREDRFAGSDLSYEDLRVRDRNDYASRMVDSTESAWIIESVPTDKGSPYRRIVSEIDKDRCVVVRAEYYDRQDRLLKILTAGDFENMGDGIWKASSITMKDVRSDRRTEIRYLERDLQKVISPDVFTDRYLRRGVQ